MPEELRMQIYGVHLRVSYFDIVESYFEKSNRLNSQFTRLKLTITSNSYTCNELHHRTPGSTLENLKVMDT